MSNEYKRLTDVLRGWWKTQWAELPDEQRQAWRQFSYLRNFTGWNAGPCQPSDMYPWASLTPRQRKSLAEQHDLMHDPANAEINKAWRDYYAAINAKKREIAEWEMMSHQGIPSEAKTKADALSRLNAEIAALMAVAPDAVKVGAGATAAIEEPETSNWKLCIQAEAARRWKVLRDAGANPTKHNIKDDLANWCRETNVLTDGDINPNAEYIYRHVLRKWMPPTG